MHAWVHARGQGIGLRKGRKDDPKRHIMTSGFIEAKPSLSQLVIPSSYCALSSAKKTHSSYTYNHCYSIVITAIQYSIQLHISLSSAKTQVVHTAIVQQGLCNFSIPTSAMQSVHASVVLGYLSHGCWETEAIYLVHGFVSAYLLTWLGLATSRGSHVANMLLRGRERGMYSGCDYPYKSCLCTF